MVSETLRLYKKMPLSWRTLPDLLCLWIWLWIVCHRSSECIQNRRTWKFVAIKNENITVMHSQVWNLLFEFLLFYAVQNARFSHVTVSNYDNVLFNNALHNSAKECVLTIWDDIFGVTLCLIYWVLRKA